MRARKKRNIKYRRQVRDNMTESIYEKYYPNQKRRHKVFKAALKTDCDKFVKAYKPYYDLRMTSKYYVIIHWFCAAMDSSAVTLRPKELISFKDKYMKEHIKYGKQTTERTEKEKMDDTPV